MRSVPELSSAPSVTAAVEDLEGAVAAVASLVAGGWLESLGAAGLLDVTARLQRVASRSRAVAVVAAGEVRDGRVAQVDGHAATTRWLEVRAGLSKAESRAVVATSERLQWEFPATRDAWLAGEVSEGAVREITIAIPRALKGVIAQDYVAQRTRLEAVALGAARNSTVTEVRRVVRRAAFAAAPQESVDAVMAAKESEFLRFTPVSGGVDVHGFLSTESAALVLTAFDRQVDSLHRSGAAAALHRGGPRSQPRGLRVGTREHRNAGVLVELVGWLLGDGLLGTKHAQRPHVTVTVHADDYRAGLGGVVLLPGFGSVEIPCSSIDRILCDAEVHPVLTAAPAGQNLPAGAFPGSVPRSTAEPWRPSSAPWLVANPPLSWEPDPEEAGADTDVGALVDFGDELDDAASAWQRLLGEPGRHVLDVGRSFRTATPKIRRALDVRDGGCVAPGCDVDASRCEAHHLVFWERLGETSLANMALLCSRHHHLVHEGGMRVEIHEGVDPGHPGYVTLVPSARHL